jgi:hypothetical protein
VVVGQSRVEAVAQWDARVGLVAHGAVPLAECVRRLHLALPTSAHAERLVAVLLERLGDLGRTDPYTDGTRIVVRRAEPAGWWQRRPVAVLARGGHWIEPDIAQECPYGPPVGWPEGESHQRLWAPEAPPIEVGPPSQGHAALALWSGDAVVELRYGDDGYVLPEQVLLRFGDRYSGIRWALTQPPLVDPTARPPQAPPPPWLVDLPDGPVSCEALAERLLAGSPDLDPVRVRMPVDAPGGVEGCWYRAVRALRVLAFDDLLATEGGTLLIDAFDHPAVASHAALGPDLQEAFANWRASAATEGAKPVHHLVREVEEPEAPETTTTTTEHADGTTTTTVSMEGLIVLRPLVIIPWPEPGPDTTPVVAVRFPPLPTEVPEAWARAGFSRWRYLVGDSGQVGAALVRDELDGDATAVGDGVLDTLDPARLDELLDVAEAAVEPWHWEEPPWVRYPYHTRMFRTWSPATQQPASPQVAGGMWNEKWPATDLDADVHRWRITRHRLHRPARTPSDG